MGRTRYARNGEQRIAYERRAGWRARRPWLVLIQGLGFDRSGWDPVARELKRHFSLLLIDNRGSGRSAVPRGAFTVSDMARDVVSVLDAAGVPRAHVAGASLGGMVAQEVAINHGERVDGLVLACTTPGWPYAYPMPAASIGLLAATRRLAPDVALRRHVENALSPETVRQHPELVERLIAHQNGRRSDPKAWYSLMSAGARFAGNRRQSRITARTLVLHGTADVVVDPRNAELLASRIPDAQLTLLPRLGHLFFWEDPRLFVDAVTAFLLAGPQPTTPASTEPVREESP